MKKAVLFIISVCICISLAACGKSTYAGNTSSSSLNEDKAISMVIKDHTDFPSSQSHTITKKLPAGGPEGTTLDVKFTTKAERISDSYYVVTLTKDWGISVNGKYAKSFWRYKVTPDNIILLDSVDNDYLPGTMK